MVFWVCFSGRAWSANARDSRRDQKKRRALNRASNVAVMRSAKIVHGALLLLAAVTSANSTKCSRLIDGVTTPRSNAEGRYNFFMTLYNRTELVYAYMPNTRYSVTLQIDGTDQLHRKFTRFLISAEAENANDTADVGIFDLQDDTMTKFADNCANAVVETSKVLKEEITVVWTSPSEGSGCILLRATVMETPDTWYMDDFDLILNMCQDSKAEADDQGPVLTDCCTCDEAKYEVTFEGLWSRNTHPKDFPSKSWLIRFSDVIGASHTGDYRFWRYNGMASIGLRQVAEHGATRKLEGELKNRSEHIRTIIKARGISYPNVTGRTFAVFRVDRKHHLMSLVSMIDPSPDWIVGVSGLELCLSNCSWIEHKELNLYPYDAGTDNGITYLSPDEPTVPQESIRRITSTYPNDSRSPFYDPAGLDMKPLAKLYLNRQRLYEKTCDDASEALDETEACRVTPWGEWGPCSVTCGRGNQLRQRHFRDEATAIANKCSTLLTDRSACFNSQSPYCTSSGRYDGILDSDMCELSEWGSWSSCSSTCGEGSMTRSRNFRQKKYRKQCKMVPNGPSLQQSIDCENDPCEGEDADEVREDTSNVENNYEDYGERADGTGEVIEDWLEKCPSDQYTEWSMWSPCSSSCGPGIKLRSRLVNNNWSVLGKDDEDSHEECKVQQSYCTAEISSCNITKDEAERICSEPMKKGRCSSNILRAYFDKQTGRCRLFSYTGCDGNRNNFPTEQDCNNVCGNFQRELRANLSAIMKNFKVSLSSVLSYHIPVQEQQQQQQQQQQHRTKAKRAQYEKANFGNIQTSSLIMESSEDIKVDCQATGWSRWTSCDGCHGYKTSTRKIMVSAKGGGKSCPKKTIRRRKCSKVPPCSEQGDGKSRRSFRDNSEEKANYGNNHDTLFNKHISVNCKVTHWSTWSGCSATCGDDAMRNRVRSVKVQPRGPRPRLCPPLAEFRKCPVVECPQ
ncbi:spondin-1 isoform X2 [Odontomachus brunneus]|uniref:spondin-1 isoform X2 n=1 Tax=Odontomachus brunneus TaxID=486640 RepID=UPI0013F1B922|nr:spondin-1 isoform X2 [Odontomachus brunneus]